RPFIGAQGWEYLDLGRLWQLLLILGLVIWCVILLRGLRQTLQREHYANLPYLFFYSALSMPLFYAVGLLAQSRTHFAIADFWRFWVVPPLGRRFPGVVHHNHGGLYLRAAGNRLRKDGHSRGLPGYSALFLRWRGRDHAPYVFQRHARHPHGARSVLLRPERRFDSPAKGFWQ